MSYASAVASLYELGHELGRTPIHKFDLAHMRVLVAALGNPERRFHSVLIAGTNGKGSTAATLASILRAAGHRTGLYTSPHLMEVNERIRIDGKAISDADFAEVHDRVEEVAQRLVVDGELPWHPSFFEMLTGMAFDYFARQNVEIAVLEVGMGGRLDATNVVEPCLSVITDIALDHQKFLGNTTTEIAREKAGIIRPNGIVVTLPQHPEANEVLGSVILERNARAVNAAGYVPSVSPRAAEFASCDPYAVEFGGKEITIDSPLTGRHQLRNVALAIAAAEQLNRCGCRIGACDVERGIRQTQWAGRFQVIPATADSPEFVLDVAHNPAGAWALRSTLSERYPRRELIFVFGAMRDKAIVEIAEILLPLAVRVIATQAENPRSATAEEICAAAARTGTAAVPEPTVAAAVRRARTLVPANAVVVITGSIYIVGEAMRALGLLKS